MRAKVICCAVLLSILLPASLLAQAGQVTGVVTTGAGEPLVGVTVAVQGTALGAITGPTGRYSIADVPAGERTLTASYIGYGTLEQATTVAAGSTVVLNFRMVAGAINLEEIVVVGYGTQRREEITGAVVSVNSDEFVQGPARDAASLIAGKMAGLAVVTPTGDPTAGTQINLRGRTTLQGPSNPLILVDGIPGTLETVPTQDIESISVLKDGSAAAVYGSRASNGVILITTKRHQGGAPTIRYDGYVSQQTISNRPDFMDASDYRRLIDDGVNFQDFGYDTNWQDEVLRSPLSHRHSVTLSGGAQNTNYTASINYENAQGIFLRSDNQEVTGRANIRHSMFDGKLEAEGNMVSRTQSNFDGPDYEWIWQMAVQRNPTDRVMDDEGNWLETSTGALRYQNPVSLIMEENGKEENRSTRMHGTLTYTPIDRLRFSLMGGTTRTNGLSGSATTFRHQDHTQTNNFGRAERSTDSGYDRILGLTGTYTGEIADHNFTLLGGYEYQDFLDEGFDASNERFPTDLFGYDQLQRGSGIIEGDGGVSSGRSSYKLIGFFSRLNYDWQNKYLLTGSVRYEGNSRFGADHKWGMFPSISAGWRISEESFMDGVDFIDDLRLRAGYGVTGIAPNQSYLSLTSYGYGARIPYGDQWVQTIAPTRNPNPDLRWEEKDEINVGLNFALLDFRLNGAVDVYRRDTRDMLYNYSVPVPPNLFGSILANVGHMQNSGVEVELGYDLIDRPGLRWNSSANWSYNTNKLVSLSNDVYNTNDCFTNGNTGAPIQQSTHRVCVGEPIGNFYGFKSIDIDDDGVWIVERPDEFDDDGNLVQAAHPISIEDITEADRQFLGNGLPKYYFGWNNTAQVGNFDLSVNMRGAAGFQILNFERMFYENPNLTAYNMLRTAFDPIYGKRTLDYDLAYVSYYVEDGDYVKLDNATIGYTIGETALGGLSSVLTNARVYISGRNLLTLTDYKGIDPEVSTGGLTPGIDNRANYPTTRMFTLGASFGF
ncbi:MAG: SusC/RagA family TonB-linked outer membrane protein [Gemmatimonadota bacterium]